VAGPRVQCKHQHLRPLLLALKRRLTKCAGTDLGHRESWAELLRW
jgi:hypothetical protein